MPEQKEKILSNQEALVIFGHHDENLRYLEQVLGVELFGRGNHLKFRGPAAAVEQAMDLVDRLREFVRHHDSLHREDIRHLLSGPGPVAKESGGRAPAAGKSEVLEVDSRRKQVVPQSPHQRAYVLAMRKYDLVVGIGPAGTGKTYLAVAAAVEAVKQGRYRRIVLTRPAIEAGERLGFLPGDLEEKIKPYLQPIYDALFDIMRYEEVRRWIERRIIEIVPLAYMRGRTLSEAFIILDEAQNTTFEQMKMFLTRLGLHSQAVVTGDVTQIDLPLTRKSSGLVEIQTVLLGVPGVKFVGFSQRDVVRHTLVKRIIDAYERHHGRGAGTLPVVQPPAEAQD